MSPGAMTTPAAWTPSLRTRPSSGRAVSMISFATGSSAYAWASSDPGRMASSRRMPIGRSGTSLAIRSTVP